MNMYSVVVKLVVPASDTYMAEEKIDNILNGMIPINQNLADWGIIKNLDGSVPNPKLLSMQSEEYKLNDAFRDDDLLDDADEWAFVRYYLRPSQRFLIDNLDQLRRIRNNFDENDLSDEDYKLWEEELGKDDHVLDYQILSLERKLMRLAINDYIDQLKQ